MMSTEVNIHSAQTSILRELLFRPHAGYAELQKPTGLTSNHFSFHMQRLQELGLVEKRADGQYCLTTAGKEYANKLDTDSNTIERQPKISVALVVEREHDGQTQYLCQQRLKNPFYGFWGRLGGKVRWGESLAEAASRELLEETGLTASFKFRALYHKRDYRTETGELLEDKLFCLMYATNVTGKLKADFEGGHNEWLTQAQFEAKPKTFASAVEFPAVIKNSQAFVEREFHYSADEY
ncbi:MAG TPA: NUDIX domain-containing protein [Candidatus Saccharimonadales bacterium]|nr:NUDIX domain-containing protein [Candidatus Saccharimonadales bacterium]